MTEHAHGRTGIDINRELPLENISLLTMVQVWLLERQQRLETM